MQQHKVVGFKHLADHRYPIIQQEDKVKSGHSFSDLGGVTLSPKMPIHRVTLSLAPQPDTIGHANCFTTLEVAIPESLGASIYR